MDFAGRYAQFTPLGQSELDAAEYFRGGGSTSTTTSGTGNVGEAEFNRGLLDLFKQQMDPNYRRQLLQEKLAFDKEQMREAGKYKMLFDLPGRITQAFALPGQIAMEGANRISNTILEGTRALPQPQVAARAYSYTPTSYF